VSFRAVAKLHAALSGHVHTATYWDSQTGTHTHHHHHQELRTYSTTEATEWMQKHYAATSTIYHSRGKTANDLSPFPSWCYLSSFLYLRWSRCLSRSKKGVMNVLRAHTSKGGGWLVVPGGDALSYASDSDFLLKRPPDGFSAQS
jgi:hypothetical protein